MFSKIYHALLRIAENSILSLQAVTYCACTIIALIACSIALGLLHLIIEAAVVFHQISDKGIVALYNLRDNLFNNLG